MQYSASSRHSSAVAARIVRVRLQGLNCHCGHRAQGRQFVLHAKALHGNPYDGHALGPAIADLEKLTGVTVRRIHGEILREKL
jgi:hypothetical protein